MKNYKVTQLTKRSNDIVLKILENNEDFLKSKSLMSHLSSKLFHYIGKSIGQIKQFDTTTEILETFDIEKKINTGKYLPQTTLEEIKEDIHYCYHTTMTDNKYKYIVDIYSKNTLYIEKYLFFIKLILSMCTLNVGDMSQNEEQRIPFYFTFVLSDLDKKLHGLETSSIIPYDLNSGYTHTFGNCDLNSGELQHTIVIYRGEEWLKVFIHECFHLFCLDMRVHNMDYPKLFEPLFAVNSEYLLEETFSEFWSRIINTSLVTYFTIKNINETKFVDLFNVNMNIEIVHAHTQCIRVLDHFNLTYDMLINKEMNPTVKLLYKEETNAFNYYVLTSLLMFNFDKVVEWFMGNDKTFMNFTKDEKSVIVFFYFIKQIYKDADYLEHIEQVRENHYSKVRSVNTLHMSAFDMMM
jgi:hypothetical protein